MPVRRAGVPDGDGYGSKAKKFFDILCIVARRKGKNSLYKLQKRGQLAGSFKKIPLVLHFSETEDGHIASVSLFRTDVVSSPCFGGSGQTIFLRVKEDSLLRVKVFFLGY